MEPLKFTILSLFPEYFDGPFSQSILGRAVTHKKIEIEHVNIRSFADNKHKRVDERPYGGGPGMVLMPEPVAKAIRASRNERSRVIFLTPSGKQLNAKRCRELASEKHLVLLCGHYEGIDQRVIDSDVDEEISVGDFVLSSGCPAAALLVDAVSRFKEGVLGNEMAASQDSFEEALLDHPCYTRPVTFEGVSVPDVLLGGNHKEVEQWRKEMARCRTSSLRPELLKGELV